MWNIVNNTQTADNMKETKTEHCLKMRISQIIETNFKICGDLLMSNEIDEKEIQVKIAVRFSHKNRDDLFSITVAAIYEQTKENISKDIALVETTTIFEIEEITNYFDFNDDTIIDKANLIPQLLSVSIGNTRGYAASKLANTPLSKFPIPMFDSKNFEPTKNRV